ncbi:MAG: YegS/Rv2252/BmrU family lipid kinase [Mogibacterium sp.]|nr:YegS/Rv2252/BmrU family lipid kinase [Mogibacterium sp.]
MNPKSGTMQAAKYLSDILQMYSAAGYMTTVLMTAKAGDARDFALQYSGDYDITVCSGGDGTFNDVVNGVLTAGSGCPIGYIPSGSTNDFATSAGLPKPILEAAARVVNGTPRMFDMGDFNGRNFSYVASFGAFTSTSYSVPQNVKNILGHSAYILQGIRDVVNIKPVHAEFLCDEGTTDEVRFEGDYVFGAVCNATIVGGVLKLDPLDVDMNDGRHEVILIETPRNLIELNETALALLDGSLKAPHVHFHSARDVRVRIDAGTHWTLDGEYEEGSEEVRIRNLRNAVRLIV